MIRTDRRDLRFGFGVRCVATILGLLVYINNSACRYDRETSRDTRAADEQAIRETDTEWSKAAATKDLDRTVSYYSEEASLLAPGAPIATGKAAIRPVWSQLISNAGFAASWQPNKVEVARAGDQAYTIGTYELTLNGADGKPMTDRGKYVVVWKKQPDGAWKAIVDMFNSDLPPPPPQPAAPTPARRSRR